MTLGWKCWYDSSRYHQSSLRVCFIPQILPKGLRTALYSVSLRKQILYNAAMYSKLLGRDIFAILLTMYFFFFTYIMSLTALLIAWAWDRRKRTRASVPFSVSVLAVLCRCAGTVVRPCIIYAQLNIMQTGCNSATPKLSLTSSMPGNNICIWTRYLGNNILSRAWGLAFCLSRSSPNWAWIKCTDKSGDSKLMWCILTRPREALQLWRVYGYFLPKR